MRKLILTVIFAISFIIPKPIEAAHSQNTIILKIASPIININGNEQYIDAERTVPIIENGRTLVPLRAIFEALSLEVDWNPTTQTITSKQNDVEIKLEIGNNKAYRNNVPVTLDAPPKILNGRTMIPLRFVAESLGADVDWNDESKTITISLDSLNVVQDDEKETIFLSFGDTKLCIGDTLTQIENTLGKADRIDLSNYDFDWHVYSSDYSRFIMVGIKDNIAEAFYTNSKGFVTNTAKYGDTSSQNHKNIVFYTDKHDNEKIHAGLIISDNVTKQDYDDEFYRVQERQNFDATNAFRVNHGLKPLEHDGIAELTARNHSQDMADNNFFDHTNLEGLSPWDRYRNNNGKNFGSGENISAGRLLGIEAFNGWVNSAGHRNNMLGEHKYLGVGYGYNKDSTYRYYMTQFFSS